MEDDLSLLRSMYVEGRELELISLPHNLTRLTFHGLSPSSSLVLTLSGDHVTAATLGTRDVTSEVRGAGCSLPSEVVEFVRGNLSMLEPSKEPSPDQLPTAHEVEGAVYQLDHIRSPRVYHKALARAARETGCRCAVVVSGHVIRVIVVGTPAAVTEFIKRHRTTNVDVDTKGRPCKERLISDLTRQPLPADIITLDAPFQAWDSLSDVPASLLPLLKEMPN